MATMSKDEFIQASRKHQQNDIYSDNELADTWDTKYAERYKVEQTGDSIAGIKSGYAGFKSMGNYSAAAVSDMVGAENTRDSFITDAQANDQEAAKWSQNRVSKVEDINGVGSAVDWAQFQLGNLVPTMAESVGAGIIGGAISGANPGGFAAGFVARGAVKDLVKHYVTGGLAKKEAEVVAEKTVDKYLKGELTDDVENSLVEGLIKRNAKVAGASAGAGAAGYQMGTGDLYSTAVETGNTDAGLSMLGAVPYAALDAVTGGVAGSQILKGMASGSRKAAFGKAMAVDAPLEGFNEAGQEELNIQLQGHYDDNYDTTGVDANSRRLNSWVVGTLAGSALATPQLIRSPQAIQAEQIDADLTAEAKGNINRGTVKTMAELQQDLALKSRTKAVLEEEAGQQEQFQKDQIATAKQTKELSKALQDSNNARRKVLQEENKVRRDGLPGEVSNLREGVLQNPLFPSQSGTVENDVTRAGGKPWKTAKEALVAIKSNKQFKKLGEATYVPVGVEGGFVLRNVRDMGQKKLPQYVGNSFQEPNPTVTVTPSGAAFTPEQQSEAIVNKRQLGSTPDLRNVTQPNSLLGELDVAPATVKQDATLPSPIENITELREPITKAEKVAPNKINDLQDADLTSNEANVANVPVDVNSYYDALNDTDKKTLNSKSTYFWKSEKWVDVIPKVLASNDVGVVREPTFQNGDSLLGKPSGYNYFFSDGRRKRKVPKAVGETTYKLTQTPLNDKQTEQSRSVTNDAKPTETATDTTVREDTPVPSPRTEDTSNVNDRESQVISDLSTRIRNKYDKSLYMKKTKSLGDKTPVDAAMDIAKPYLSYDETNDSTEWYDEGRFELVNDKGYYGYRGNGVGMTKINKQTFTVLKDLHDSAKADQKMAIEKKGNVIEPLFEADETDLDNDWNDATSVDDGDVPFSIGSKWTNLSKEDAIFRYKKSDSKNISTIINSLTSDFNVVEETNIRAEGIVKAWKVSSKADPKVYSHVIHYNDGRVVLNALNMKQGSNGSALYAAVANYAVNNDLKFHGDTLGISPTAMFRRLEATISAALKFASTDNVLLHDSQIMEYGIDWIDGDTEHNLTEMLDASFNALSEGVPELSNATYDIDTDTFSISNKEIDTLVNKARNAGIPAGKSTIKRAILTNTLHKDGLPDGIKLPEVFTGVLYSKSDKVDGQTIEQTTLDLRQDKDLANAIDKGVVKIIDAKTSDLILEREKKDPSTSQMTLFQEDDIIQGFVKDGTAYIVADNNTSATAKATAYHEMFHVAMESMPSSKRESILSSLEKKLKVTPKTWVSRAESAIPDNTNPDNVTEELGAYAITQYELDRNTTPKPVRDWVESLIASVKAAVFKLTGKVFGELNPAMLRALAKAYAGKGAVRNTGNKNSIASTASTVSSSIFSPEGKAKFDDSRKSLAKKVGHWIREYWTKEGLTNEVTHNLKVQTDGLKMAGQKVLEVKMKVFRNDIAKLLGVKDYNKIDADTILKLNTELNGGETDLSREIKNLIRPMREYVDHWSNEMIGTFQDLMDIELGKLSPTQRADAELYFSTTSLDENGVPTEGKINTRIANILSIQQTIEENKGTYLNRSYQAFDDTKWKEKVLANEPLMVKAREHFRTENLQHIANNTIGTNAKNRDQLITDAIAYIESKGEEVGELSEYQQENLYSKFDQVMSEEEIEGSISEFLQRAKDKGDLTSLVSSGQVYGHKDGGMLKKRKSLDPIILELLGEHKDPLVNFAQTITKMQWYVGNHKFLMNLREAGLGDFIRETSTVEGDIRYDKALGEKGSETLSPIDGLFVTVDFYNGLQDFNGGVTSNEGYVRQFIKYNAMVKYGKVVIAPTTMARNFLSAGFFLSNMGHNPFSKDTVAALKIAKDDLFGVDNNSLPYLKKLIEMGVLHDNAMATELRKTMDDFIELSDGPLSDTRGFVGGVKSANEFLQNAYRFGDDFWKIIAFEKEKRQWMAKGMDESAAESKAAIRVRNSIPTYSMVPKAIQMIRRTPLIGAFVAFPYEILRTTYNSLGYIQEDFKNGDKDLAWKRIAGMAATHSFATAASAMSMAAFGIDDEEDKLNHELSAVWSKNSVFIYTGMDEDGNRKFIDSTYTSPYSIITKVVNAIISDHNVDFKDKFQDATGELLDPFTDWDIVTGSLIEIATNTKDSGGRIYNEQDPLSEQYKDIAGHFGKAAAPGVWGNIDRSFKAATGTKSRSGQEYNGWDEAIALVGIRQTTLDTVQAMRYKGFQMRDNLNDAQQLLSHVVSDRNELSEATVEDAFNRMIYAKTKQYNQVIRIVEGMRASGDSDQEIRRAMLASKFSQKDIGKLMRGDVPEWQMSSQFLDNAIAGVSASSISTDKKRKAIKMFNERKRIIREIARQQQN